MLLNESRTSHYRAFIYRNEFNGCREYKYLSDDGDIRELDDWLNDKVWSGYATGGDIEMYVPEFGWCIYED